MACFGSGSVRLRGMAGSVTRALRYGVVGKPVRSVFSLASARSFPVKSIASQSRSPSIIGRSLPSSLSCGRYCIRTTTTSRGYGTDSKAGRIYRSLESSPDGKKLCVSWADEEESTYHAVWLRHNCRCPQCWDDRNAGPMVYFDSLKNVEIKATEVSGDGGILNVRWGYSDSTEEHTGYLSLHYLKRHSYSASALQRRREKDRPLVADHLPTMAYPDIMSDEKYLWMWLKNVNLYGMCLLTDMPCEEDEVMKLSSSIGGSLSTIFGEKFKVVVKNAPDDLSYTDKALPYHMDMAGWMESPPGLQILHCIMFDDCIEGGESLVLDTLPVLEELREKHPKQFEILCTVPTSFQRKTVVLKFPKVENHLAMERQRPHIMLDGDGEITAVYIHPNSEGPLFISEDKVEAYYDAYCLLQEMLATSKHQHKFRLLPGQTMTVNNRRCVHARSEIKLNGGRRSLQGTFVSSDNLKSITRILAEKYEPDFVLKRTFNLEPL